MTDRFVTVPDSLELPEDVKVPSARLSDSTAAGRALLAAADAAAQRTSLGLGTAATTAATDYATAAQGAKADATEVEQVALTAPLAYTLPAGTPADVVHSVVFTQDGTGGHTVTYGGLPVAVESAAGAETLVEIWPNGEAVVIGAPVAAGSVAWADVTNKPTTYTPSAHTQAASTITDFAEAVQDAVAAMLVSGANVTLTYDDALGKVTVTASGGDAELMRDTIGAAIVGTNGVSVAVNDAADTITLSISGVTAAQVSGLATVATSGSYADLTGKPTIPDSPDDIGAAPATQAINAQTGSYTLVGDDAGKMVKMTLATAADLTVPANVFTAGQRVDIADRGTARVTVVAGSGMTVNPPAGGSLVMEGQYSAATLFFWSATEADLVGLVAAS